MLRKKLRYPKRLHGHFTHAELREKISIDLFEDVSETLNKVKSLVELLNGLDNMKLCDGCGTTETFKELNLNKENNRSYQRKDGQEDISVENRANIRSTDCAILIATTLPSCQS